ncbi:exopolysaccharide biosynthesis polyprenyl glycosylphosphotransferase [Candidatus Omnitrophota bacterium]
MRRRSNILGLNIDKLNTEDVLGYIDEAILREKKTQVSYINAHCVNLAFSDQEYKDIVSRSDLLYPDGMAIVWASYLYGDPLPERVNLGDFFYKLCKLCVDKRYKIFLLGGKDNIAKKAASNLRTVFPELNIVGTYHGFFSREEENDIIDLINNSSADIVLVGMGVPKQEKWIAKNRGPLAPPILWGVGALFDYYSNSIRRAPIILRRLGFEWFFRLVVEPSRLWRRYIIGNILFLFRLLTPIFIDITLVALSWILAYMIRYIMDPFFSRPIGTLGNYLFMLMCIMPAWPLICGFFGLYRAKKTPGQIGLVASILKVSASGLVFTAVFSYIFREVGIARSFLGIWSVLIFSILLLSRFILTKSKAWFLQQDIPSNALIVSSGRDSIALKEKLLKSLSYKMVGLLDGPRRREEDKIGPDLSLGIFADLDDVINKYNIDEVLLFDAEMSISEKLNLVIKYLDSGISFKIISKELDTFSERVKIRQMENKPVLELKFREVSAIYIIAKEIIDRLGAMISLIIILPLWILITILIKLDSRGPAIFTHTRVGKDGHNFRLYKFRTMLKDVDPQKPSPADDNDERVTKLGRVLRRWSIDELPQLLNVLKGDMSLVGPRPEMPFIVNSYQSWQRQRLKVKPGITGLWQIAGRKDIPLSENIEYDFYYINDRSFMLDLAIVIKSIPIIVRKKGAY